MRFPATGTTFLLLAALIVIVVAPAQPAAAAEPYCSNPAHASPGEVPADLMPAFATAFQLDAASVGGGAFVRCVGRQVMGCYTGANLNCFKADTRRALPEATAWCHDHPGSQGIPMAATGHATIYDLSCKSRRAVAGKIVSAVDPHGYEADNWKELH